MTIEFKPTGLAEFDRTVGGGLMPGSAILLNGPRGTGKSVLAMQVVDRIVSKSYGVLYVAKKGAQWAHLLTEWLRIKNSAIHFLPMSPALRASQIIDAVLEQARAVRPALIVFDFLPKGVSGASIAETLVGYCKSTGASAILLNGLTKKGEPAGGEGLEHSCDTVLDLSAARGEDLPTRGDIDPSNVRVLISAKNRYAATGLRSLWRMTSKGFEAVR
jgi:DNA repair protein RadA/Sms